MLRKRIQKYFKLGIAIAVVCNTAIVSVFATPAPDYAASATLPQCSTIDNNVTTANAPTQRNWGETVALTFSAPTRAIGQSELAIYEVDATGAPIVGGMTYTIPARTRPTGAGNFETLGADATLTVPYAMMFIHRDDAGNAVCRSDISYTQFQGIETDVRGVQVRSEICSSIGQTFVTSVNNPEYRTTGEAVEVSFSDKNSAAQAGRLVVRDVDSNQQFTAPAFTTAENGFTNIVSDGFPGQQNRTVEVFFEHTTADGSAVVCRSNSKFINFNAPQTSNFSSAAPVDTEAASSSVVVENCKRVFYLDGSDAFTTIPAGATHVAGNDITGSSCDDTIYGNANNNVIDGLGGDDTILGFDGNDTINGGNGQDHIQGGKDDDIINGGSANDILFGGDECEATDLACQEAHSGNDTINGDAGADKIYGGNEKCQETGTEACVSHKIGDVINGGDGADHIEGGNERCGVNAEEACAGALIGDRIDGGKGNDHIEGGNEDCSDSTAKSVCDSFHSANPSANLNVSNNPNTDLTHVGDIIDGGAGNDTIIGGNEACDNNSGFAACGAASQVGDTITGGAGDDTITGGNETCNNNGVAACNDFETDRTVGDVIDGGAGNDIISGGNEACGTGCGSKAIAGDTITDTGDTGDIDTVDAGDGDDAVDVNDGDTNDTVTNAETVTSDTPGDGNNANE